MHELTESELKQVLVKNLPAIDQHGESVERIGHGDVRLRLPFRKEYLGPIPGDTPTVSFIQGRW
jgi:hypothetical protein